MKLLIFENYEVKPSPEIMLVKPFRKLYNQDRSKNKEVFMQQMSYVFFMVDPRSTYAYMVDEEEREKAIIEQEGLPADFHPSSLLVEAMTIYAKHTETSSSRLLNSVRTAIDALAEEMNHSKELLMERTDKGARVTKANDLVTSINNVMKMIPQLQDLEKKVAAEISEKETRAKGAENKMFEDGVF